MEREFIENQSYIKAKKRVEEIKGFYIHLLVMVFVLPLIVYINLQFTPGYHWFWWAVIGNLIGLFFHWFGVFGFRKIGFSKEWEERKIREFMNKQN